MADLPPELALENCEIALSSIDVCDMDVIDEVGESDEEEDKKPSKKRDEKSRSRSHRSSRDRSHGSRNRSRSPRRYGRSRSRDRIRRRSSPKRKSPAKKDGAASFLKEIQQQFGEFEGLKEVQKKVETHTILDERDRDERNRIERNRVPIRGGRNSFQQNNRKKEQNNQKNYQNMNGMQQQMVINPMNAMGMNQMMMMGGPAMPYQMPMINSGYCGGLVPPGVDVPSIDFGMPGTYMTPQPVQMPEPCPPVVQNPIIPVVNEGRNVSPPPDIGLGSISSQLLSENRLPLSEYLETQVSRGSGKTIEARSLRERVLLKCKAALHRLENASQFENKFLHVSPSYPSDESEPIGASPILPSKQNPVFRFSFKQKNAIKNSRPYPAITRNVYPIISQLGIDESVIARRLEATNREQPLVLSSVIQTKTSNSANPAQILPVRAQMRDQSCQTSVFSCPNCEDRYENCINVSTQTQVIEKYSGSCQTDEADFTLAKLKLRNWEKKKQAEDIDRLRDFQREFGIEDGETDEEIEDKKPTIRPGAIGPPGFREQKHPPPRRNYEDRQYYGRY